MSSRPFLRFVYSAVAVVSLAARPTQAADGRIAALLDQMLVRAEAEASGPERSAAAEEETETGAAPDPLPDPLGLIRKHVVHFSTSGRPHFDSSVRRLAPFREGFEEIFARQGVPRELIWLGLVESGFVPYARSPKSAVGVWQFIPETASRFGLSVGANDERLDPLKSARAAARYLKFLHGLFGDWKLVLAAYNAGEKRVADAMRRSGSRDFWQISKLKLLPQETREYVPAVLAAQHLGGGLPDDGVNAGPSAKERTGSVVYAQLGGM